MLTPQYLAGLPDPIVELYSKAEQTIIADMARRISRYDWTASVDWQYRKLREAGMMHDAIIERLASITGKTKKEIEGLISEAASKSLVADKAIYKAQGLTVPPLNQNKPMLEILQEGYKALTGALQNITKTTAQTATRQFEKVLDDAWMQVQTGAFSADEAIRRAAGALAENGLQAITYKETGHIDTLEVAVRRAVVTGVNQTCGKVQMRLAEELGSDLMELTAHSGARPSHAKWQGKIVSLSGQPGYLSLADIGYGTGDGFKGWNCRHDWNPYFEGMPRTWTDEQLAKLEEKKFEYNGQKMTEYEAQQQQRYIERNIRRWKREKAAMEAAGQDTSKSDKKIREWNARQADFLEQTGLKRQYNREWVYVPYKKRSGLGAKGEGSLVPDHKKPEIIGKVDFLNPDMIQSVLEKFEASAVEEKIETACVISKDGTVYKCYGSEDRVYPDADLGDKLIGAHVTHNHPAEETSWSFSDDDMDLFVEYKLARLRGCDEKYIYEFTLEPDDIDTDVEDWQDEYRYQHVRMIEEAKKRKIGYRRWLK